MKANIVTLIASSCIAVIAVVWLRSAPPEPDLATADPPAPALPSQPLTIAEPGFLGNPSARWVVIVYSDFQCPACGLFARERFPEVARDFTPSGDYLLVFKHRPLESIHPEARQAAELAVCAGRAGRFWQTHDALFALKGELVEARTTPAVANMVGSKDFDACLKVDGPRRVSENIAEADAASVSSVPALFFGHQSTPGSVTVLRRASGALTPSRFRAELRAIREISSTPGSSETESGRAVRKER